MRKLLFIVVGVLLLTACGNKQKFDENLREGFRYSALTAASSRMITSATTTVWHDAIYDHEDSHGNYVSDFNEALSRLYKEYGTSGIMDSIKLYKNTMDSLTKELGNPPYDRKEVHDDFIKLVGEVNSLYSMATKPSGSLSNYSVEVQRQWNTISKLDNEFQLKYAKLLKKE